MLKYQRVSPKKLKPPMRLVRNPSVMDAEITMKLTPKKGARIVMKAIKAAHASYKDKAGSEARPADELVIAVAKVDRGPTLKRFRPAWRGRAVPIMKRTSHITVEVKEGGL
jgi:large subunit ribosomal protein L22